MRNYCVTPYYGARPIMVMATDAAVARTIARQSVAKSPNRAPPAPDTKGDSVKNIQANRGIEIAYRRQLESLIADMHASIEYWLTAAYRNDPPRMTALVNMAQDATVEPSAKMKRVLSDLAKRWIKKFDDSAPLIAETYMRSQFKASDNSFKQALKDAGWTVKFTLTPTIRDALNASMQENIGLIRSIPAEYLQQVQGVVMRSYTAGRDLKGMIDGINALYPKVSDRAVIIARDQSNKANAVVNRARGLELGIREGIWMHSGAGKVPRPKHLKAGKDKLRFELAKGAPVGEGGDYVLPGQEINCRCTWRCVLPK